MPAEPSTPLTRDSVAILKEADRKIQSLAFGSHHLLYQFVRLTIARIAPVDSFYVGYYCPGQEMLFPYSFDGQEYDDPERFPYSDDGLSAWILTHKRAYCYAQDKGYLLNKGRSYGDTSKVSQDAIAVPLIETRGSSPSKVLGVLGIQSYGPDVYDEAVARAFQWLADSMATALLRERDDEARRRALGEEAEAETSAPRAMETIVEGISERLKAIRNRVEAVANLMPDHPPELCAAVDALRHECEVSQTETIELLLRAVLLQERALPALTAKQREVLGLMVEGLTNRQIAERLFISEQTAKTHVSAVIAQFGVSGRSGVVEIARRLAR